MKFMEVDGVVSEINGDIDVVNVKIRESGKGDIGNQVKNQLENFMGWKDGEKKIDVTYSKRKCVEESFEG